MHVNDLGLRVKDVLNEEGRYLHNVSTIIPHNIKDKIMSMKINLHANVPDDIGILSGIWKYFLHYALGEILFVTTGS